MFSRMRNFLYEPVILKYNTKHDSILDSRSYEIKQAIAQTMPDNIALQGYKCYSAGEEDGMIETIFEKIKPATKTFLEIGSGSGYENNSHFLLLNGWQGMWVDGNPSFIQTLRNALGKEKFSKLLTQQSFVTKDNVQKLFDELYNYYKINEVDFFSLDIDGNDYHVMESVFKHGVQPKVVCVEYNAKWGKNANVKVAYDETFVWKNDDYMGVGLGAWLQLFKENNYTLLSCDICGNNAFFIKNEFAHLFTIYHPGQLYQPARYYLVRKRSGHPPTLKMLKDVLNNE